MYATLNNSDDLTLMLQDYTLDSRLSRDVMNKVIIRELGAMRPFVNDTKVFKFSLENFFNKWNYNIGKLIDTMYYEYDPISNKNLSRTLNEGEKRESSADIDNADTYTTNKDSEEKVSAYDSIIIIFCKIRNLNITVNKLTVRLIRNKENVIFQNDLTQCFHLFL